MSEAWTIHSQGEQTALDWKRSHSPLLNGNWEPRSMSFTLRVLRLYENLRVVTTNYRKQGLTTEMCGLSSQGQKFEIKGSYDTSRKPFLAPGGWPAILGIPHLAAALVQSCLHLHLVFLPHLFSSWGTSHTRSRACPYFHLTSFICSDTISK